MPRRGENIHKRKDGRWEGRFIERYTQEEKTKYKSVYGATYTEVKNKLRNIKAVTKIHTLNSTDMEGVCYRWLEYVNTRIKQSSYANYHNLIYRHILPYFK